MSACKRNWASIEMLSANWSVACMGQETLVRFGNRSTSTALWGFGSIKGRVLLVVLNTLNGRYPWSFMVMISPL